MTIDLIGATYRVVTPAFIGGARPEHAEFRIASFKGVLRWYWRALAWKRYGELRQVRDEEAELFGSPRAQARVVIRSGALASNGDRRPVSLDAGSTLEHGGAGIGYLGYGVVKPDGRSLTKGCLRAPLEFTLELRCRDLNEQQMNSLCDALRAFGLLGGLGARSRRGFGSAVLARLEVNGEPRWEEPISVHDLAQRVRALRAQGVVDARCAPAGDGLPPYTALSPHARHVLVAAATGDVFALLDRVGRELVWYRSWGRNGKVLDGVASERNFKDDHDLMKQPQGSRQTYPRRIAFGLPQNYSKSDSVKPAIEYDRRASPLLIHIHDGPAGPAAVLSFLPSVFLPQGAKIKVGESVVSLQVAGFWEPITDFLDRFSDPQKCKETFGEVVRIP